VPTKRAAFINGVLLNQWKQQLAINVTNFQAFNPDRDMLPLCSVTPLTPCIQVCLHLRLNYLFTQQTPSPCSITVIAGQLAPSQRMLGFRKQDYYDFES